jgi:hypothetical protein
MGSPTLRTGATGSGGGDHGVAVLVLSASFSRLLSGGERRLMGSFRAAEEVVGAGAGAAEEVVWIWLGLDGAGRSGGTGRGGSKIKVVWLVLARVTQKF